MTAAIHELHGIGDINSNDVAILVLSSLNEFQAYSVDMVATALRYSSYTSW